MLLYAFSIFLSSLLLFQVQPIIAKAILPWFGGTAAVWTTCMLFFQIVLLFGYMYAHWVITRLEPRWQLIVHATVLAVSLLLLPIAPDPRLRPVAGRPPIGNLGLLLLTAVGAQYFILSTTSPLCQAWFAATRKSALPYRLFGLSNAASLLGLLAFPTLIEPFMGTRLQLKAWSVAYAAYAVVCVAAMIRTWRARGVPVLQRHQREEPNHIGAANWALWIVLPACASALLLAVTNYLCQDVAPVPFLWVLPLVCYLATFVLCFGCESWYRPKAIRWALIPAFGLMGFSGTTWNVPLAPMIAAALLALFVACLFCHGELVRIKPAPRHLTAFYFAMSLGGAIGGLFVGLAAPVIYSRYSELPVAVIACGFLALCMARGGPKSPQHVRLTMVGIVFVIGFMAAMERIDGSGRIKVRNFYGALRVQETNSEAGRVRMLYHGTTAHGSQLLDRPPMTPTTYYGPASAPGILLGRVLQGPRRIGVVGLGVGTLAAYAQGNDYFRFYEINPQIVEIASKDFAFLPQCRARYDVVLGDGRISLEREPNQNFDLLVLDAFSGDSVPVHLLTREAVKLYFRHLKPDGVLIVHISNRYLDLAPVVAGACDGTGHIVRIVRSSGDRKLGTTPAWCAVVSANPKIFKAAGWGPNIPDQTIRPWTDDYSNLFSIIMR